MRYAISELVSPPLVHFMGTHTRPHKTACGSFCWTVDIMIGATQYAAAQGNLRQNKSPGTIRGKKIGLEV